MAAAVASTSKAAATGTEQTIDPGKPAGSVAGDLLIAFFGNDWGGPNLTASTGWTEQAAFSNGTNSTHMKVFTADGAVAATQFSTQGTDEGPVVIILRITGHDPTTPIVLPIPTAGATAVSTTSLVAPSVTPATTTDLLLCATTSENSTTAHAGRTVTPPASMTAVDLVQTAGWTTLCVAKEQLASGSATGTRTFTTGDAQTTWVAASVSVKPASGSTQISLSDTVTAADQLNNGTGVPWTGSTPWVGTDPWPGPDSGGSVPITLSDTGSATDAQTVAVTVALTDLGSGADSLGTSAPLLPPTNLTAVAVSATEIDLSWDAMAGASSYDVERDGVVIVTGHSGNSYADTGLSQHTTYSYRVRSRA